MAELSLALLRHGYRALPSLWESRSTPESDHVRARFLRRRAHVVRGPVGARLFYDETLVGRSGVVPAPLAHLLFGKGAGHGLDGPEHRARKSLFLEVLTPDRVAALGDEVTRTRTTTTSSALPGELDRMVLSWPDREPVGLFDELVRVYGTRMLPWAGVDAGPGEAATVARRLARIVDGFGFAPTVCG